ARSTTATTRTATATATATTPRPPKEPPRTDPRDPLAAAALLWERLQPRSPSPPWRLPQKPSPLWERLQPRLILPHIDRRYSGSHKSRLAFVDGVLVGAATAAISIAAMAAPTKAGARDVARTAAPPILPV